MVMKSEMSEERTMKYERMCWFLQLRYTLKSTLLRTLWLDVKVNPYRC